MDAPLVPQDELLFFQPHYQQLHQKRLDAITSMEMTLTNELIAKGNIMNASELAKLQNSLWLVKRLKGLSGSTIATVVGLNDWQTPYDLWLEYTMKKERSQVQTAAQEWGHRLEPVIAQKYADQLGCQLMEVGLQQCRDYPFLLGSLDRAVLDTDGKPCKVLEIKTAAANHATQETDEDGTAIKAWGSGNVYHSDGSLAIQDSQVPKQYIMQVMCYMIVTGLRQADVAVLMNTNTFRIFTVNFDADIARMMIKAADRFWCQNVLDEVPPVMKEEDAKTLEVEKDKAVEANSDIESALTELKEVQLNIKDLSQREKELRDQVLGFMGSAAKLTANGKCLATYTMCKGRESFNSKRFSLEYPELYASYMEQGPSYRRFVIKK